ncbi:Integrase zinc binding domain [Popillia japonica]|uniref:Integrase zinc binding domain n=1 Tax=Popillia japonica TaxID=7064 RepID=A0AAW1HFV6_POPJA
MKKFWTLEEVKPIEPRFMNEEEKVCENLYQTTTRRHNDGKFIVRLPLKDNLINLGDSYEEARRRFLSLEQRFKRKLEFKKEYANVIHDYISQHHMSENGISINEAQYVGPTIQDDLFAILARFRTHKYVVTADVTQMYRQMKNNVNIKRFYGTHKYVVTADVTQMYRQVWIDEEQRKYQKILWRENPSDELKSYTLNTPSSTIDDLATIKINIANILEQAGFKLRKWKDNYNTTSYNSVNALVKIPETSKVLGLYWNNKRDTFSFNVNIQRRQVTKRTILSTTAQLFDPLGLIAPVIVIAKLLMQEIWQLKLSWDEGIPIGLYNKWIIWIREIQALKDIEIPRLVLTTASKEIQMHGFCDASEKAYGACVYLRSKYSQIVLSWIKATPAKWKTFVANRVALIQESTNISDWYHVKSKDNSADVLSRGCYPSQLRESELWWNGPSFLKKNLDFQNIQNLDIDAPEKRKETTLLVLQRLEFPFENFSNLNNLIRTFAWCLRFKHNAMENEQKRRGGLSLRELNAAFTRIIKLSQMQAFPHDYKALAIHKEVNHKSNILSLNPFIDEYEIIRVGGRLNKSTLKFDERHPILLPKNAVVTKLIFENKHKELLHAGPTLLLSAVRQRYWLISGMNLAKKTVRSCVKCFRFASKTESPIMGGTLLRFTIKN